MKIVPTNNDSQCLACGFSGLLFDDENCPKCGEKFDEAEFDIAVTARDNQIQKPNVGICEVCERVVLFKKGRICPGCGLRGSESALNAFDSKEILEETEMPSNKIEERAGLSQYGVLQECGPLDDPVRYWIAMSVVLFVVSRGVFLLGGTYQAMLVGGPEAGRITLSIIHAITIAPAIMVLVMLPFIVIARNRKRVVFLRAFSRDADKEDISFRQLVRACLPPGHQLAGIRSPRNRSWSGWKLLGDSVKALRYVGTDRFELEAPDHNWFARLLSTLSQSRAIILDTRTLTTHVHDEIRLIQHLAMSPGRVFLIVKPGYEPAELQVALQQVIGHDSLDLRNMRILVAPVDSRKPTIDELRALREGLSTIRDSVLPITTGAYKFVLNRVGKENWATPWREKPMVASIWIIAVFSLLAFFLPRVGIGIRTLYLGTFSIFFLVATIRLWKSAFRQMRYGGKPSPRISMMFLSLLGVQFLVIDWMARADMDIKRGREARTVNMVRKMRLINFGLLEFDREYGSLPDSGSAEYVGSSTGIVLQDDGSSNAVLRQLIASGYVDESNFSDNGYLSWTREADGIVSPPERILERGECAFSITDLPNSGYSSEYPFLLYPMISGTERFDPDILGGKALVLRMNGTVERVSLDSDGKWEGLEEFRKSMETKGKKMKIRYPLK